MDEILDKEFLQENMMGPNAWRIDRELTEDLPLQKGMQVLDLGCGRGLTSIFQMVCFEKAWEDWLSCRNPYAVEDRPMMETDKGRYMNLIRLTGRVV